MICKFIIIGAVYEAPRKVRENAIVFRVVSKTGSFDPRPIIVTVTAYDELAKRFADLKRGNQVMVDGDPRATPQGNPLLHSYEDKQPYTIYEIDARNISQIKSLA